MSKPKDVDAYIASVDKQARPLLESLRAILKTTIPEVEESISYNVPMYTYYGIVAGLAVYKNHISVGFGEGILLDKDRTALEEKGYILGKGTLQIKFDQEIPTAMIKKILTTKAKINEASLSDTSLNDSMNPKVNFYFTKARKWQDELEKLRIIVLSSGLTEELKWGVPCYTLEKNNVVLIHVFKEYCALLFFKGALLKDTDSLLIQQTKNVQAGRQIRFTSLEEIKKMSKVLRAYINEAIVIEKSGLKIDFKKTTEFSMPSEFKTALDKNTPLKNAFNALTPGRQRAYILYFSAPKQSKTIVARIEKSIPQIMDGKGLNDL